MNNKYLTSVHRAKKISMQRDEDDDSEIRNTTTSNISNNNGIYNKKNIHLHIKKINIDLEGKNADDRRQSGTPVYQKSRLLNPISYTSSYRNQNYNNQIIFPNNNLDKIKKQEKITSPQNAHKMNKFYKFGIAMTSPDLIKDMKENEIEQISITAKNKKYKKYLKINNMKTQVDKDFFTNFLSSINEQHNSQQHNSQQHNSQQHNSQQHNSQPLTLRQKMVYAYTGDVIYKDFNSWLNGFDILSYAKISFFYSIINVWN